MRALLNYVASAGGLIDHSRRIMRGRSGPIVDAFEERKAELLTHPEVPFLKDLRNFVLHHALPFIGNEIHLQPRSGVIATSEIKLSTTDLLGGDRWTRESKAFIESAGDVVPLRPLIQRHSELMRELNLWLYEQLADANAPAIAELNELVVERNAVLGGSDLTEARRVTQTWTALRESPTLDAQIDVTTLMPRPEASRETT